MVFLVLILSSLLLMALIHMISMVEVQKGAWVLRVSLIPSIQKTRLKDYYFVKLATVA